MTTTLVILMSLFSTTLLADRAIYGDDNRQEYYEIKEAMIRHAQHSVAAMVSINRITNGRLKGPLLSKKVCPSARFATQPMVAKCTGFLVSPTLIATAGHCFKKKRDCDDFRWVFGFNRTTPQDNSYPAPHSEIYSCKRVVERKFSGFGAIDHAVIELDRPVIGREPLLFRKEGKLADDATLLSIGHPTGLPVKFVLHGALLENDHDNFFATDLDSFGGNSGSPVLNHADGRVEGIVNRGHGAYVWNESNTCKIPKVCQPGECNLARATRMSNIEILQEI